MTLYDQDYARAERINGLRQEALRQHRIALCKAARGRKSSLRWRIGQGFIDLGERIGGLRSTCPAPEL